MRKSASDALARHAEEVDALLVSIRNRVERIATDNAETTDWGHAGSLGYVAEKLAEIESFLGGAS